MVDRLGNSKPTSTANFSSRSRFSVSGAMSLSYPFPRLWQSAGSVAIGQMGTADGPCRTGSKDHPGRSHPHQIRCSGAPSQRDQDIHIAETRSLSRLPTFRAQRVDVAEFATPVPAIHGGVSDEWKQGTSGIDRARTALRRAGDDLHHPARIPARSSVRTSSPRR